MLFLIIFTSVIGICYLGLATFLTYHHTTKQVRKVPRKSPHKKVPHKKPNE